MNSPQQHTLQLNKMMNKLNINQSLHSFPIILFARYFWLLAYTKYLNTLFFISSNMGDGEV